MSEVYTHAPVTRLRREPEATAEVIEELPPGTPLEIHDRGEQFFLVTAWHPELGQLSGYVHKIFIQGDMSPTNSRPVTPKKKPSECDIQCPVCGGHEWRMAYIGHAWVVLNWFTSIIPRVRLCLICGMVQPFLDDEGLEIAKAHFREKERRE